MCMIDPMFEDYFENNLKESNDLENEKNVVNSIDINLLNEDLPEDLPENIKKLFTIDDEVFDASLNILETKTEKKARQKESQSALDRKLVEKFYKDQSSENFNKLWERFFYGVKSHAYKYVRDWEVADDMACQTFERAWDFRDKYDINKAVFSTWIYTICRNLCLGLIYKKNKDNYVNQDISDMYDSAILGNCLSSGTESTQYIVNSDGTIEANSLEDLTQRMYDSSIAEIESLGGNYSKILKMKLIEDKKIREIADELNMNESTVKNYLYKGEREIQAIVKKKYKGLYEMYLEAKADEAEKEF